MTAATLHTEPRHGWRALLWIAPLTASWIALNYAVPIIPASGISTVTARVFIHVLAAGTMESRRAAAAWNVFGLLDFTIAVGIALMITPGPLQVIAPNIPNATAGIYPTVMIPAFAVPSSILLHLLSLRQLRRRNRA